MPHGRLLKDDSTQAKGNNKSRSSKTRSTTSRQTFSAEEFAEFVSKIVAVVGEQVICFLQGNAKNDTLTPFTPLARSVSAWLARTVSARKVQFWTSSW
jgi:hypothetical protein